MQIVARERSLLHLSGIDFGASPAPDEIEITIIGPGYGESICVHVGSGRWVVIDSCLDDLGTPWPLTYLNGLNVDINTQVDLLVTTHWHDDHAGGLAECLAAFGNATFVLPSVFTNKEFSKFVYRYQENPTARVGARVSEFDKVFEILERRREKGLVNATSCRADQGKVLRIWPSDLLAHNSKCTLTSLSPSHLAENQFLARIVQTMPNTKVTKGSAPDPGKNDASVAIWMSVGNREFLFGADLEEHGNSATGWSAVLNADNCPSGMASLFKVSHHGSNTGDHPMIWETRIAKSAVAVVTPWRIADGLLPGQKDIRRLKTYRRNLYQTAPPKNKTKKISTRPVIAMLREMGAIPVSLSGDFGAVRYRFKPNIAESESVELFGAAKQL